MQFKLQRHISCGLLAHMFFLCLITFGAQSADVDFQELRKVYSKPSSEWPKADIDEGIDAIEIGLLPEVSFPKDNPYSKAKAKLGERLFHDGQLSRSGQIACASCHDSDLGWGDGRQNSFGHNRQRGKRNAPTIENIAFVEPLFWDGRAKTVEQQALMPIQDPIEMNFTLEELETRLNADQEYKAEFKQVFNQEFVSSENIAKALATYQRTITSRLSDFDRFLMASEQKSERMKDYYRSRLSDQALWGMHLFRTKARCMNCHFGPTFSDNKFHNIGLTYYKREYEDLGLYNVTKNNQDTGKFKTPGLRGVFNTKPWMHNGLFSDMTGILNIYNAGGVPIAKDPNDPMSPETSRILKPLQLSQQEIQAIVAFLHSITAVPAGGPAPEFLN